MKLQHPIIAVMAIGVLTACLSGCSTPVAPSHTAPAKSSTILIDGDSAGYVTYDTDREILTGHRADGRRAWRKKGIFPSEAHCMSTCPDAVVSAPANMNPGNSNSRTYWITSKGSTRRTFSDKKFTIHWARDSGTWIASSGNSLAWSNDGKMRSKKFSSDIAETQARISVNQKSLIVSVHPRSLPHKKWKAFSFHVDAQGNRAVPTPTESKPLPGPVACISAERNSVLTAGANPVEFDLSTGKAVTKLGKFLSDCASSKDGEILGTFSMGTNKRKQEIRLKTRDTSDARAAKAVTDGDGEIGIVRDCGVYISDGRLATLTTGGRVKKSKIRASSLLTIPNGSIYTVEEKGNVNRHLIAAGTECQVR
ncbi:hypothetical protein IPZ61_16400 [Streptomyces sioyaensis]|uniref:hypothetical protein n=1 Tax=Streptomyces sioyaensis TaxID=67364 RepID=UPI001F447A40|nr:hypothetical protein [Streptomyces sioyaensis]MCF3174892.1 hypothetical protein [Streptomyces sioyaensis]